MATDNEPISVFLVDDDGIFRVALRALLRKEPGLDVVGDCANPTTAIRHIATLQPDVVLLDIVLPGMSGIEMIPKIRTVHAACRIVMITHMLALAKIQEAFDAGADGYVTKDVPFEELLATVRATLDGERRFSHGAVRAHDQAERMPEA